MISAKVYGWTCGLIVLILFKAVASDINITYVKSAVTKGAVCLDGSPPAYHLSPGFGSGVNNWLVHLEGGGWCNSTATCLTRKNTHLGSSKLMSTHIPFSGILSDVPEFNPDFYNWNKVKVRYCDGSSFTGDVEGVDPVSVIDLASAAAIVYFARNFWDHIWKKGGARVWSAVMEDLLARGMNEAENALLSGCSAGGLASIIHCDSFQILLPASARVKCLSDAGFFINVKDISGSEYIKAFFSDVVITHGSTNNLPHCTSPKEPGTCFFPQYIAQGIETPLFILNAAYDSWQVRNILVPTAADPRRTWRACRDEIKNCNSTQLQVFQAFRVEFLKALNGITGNSSRGMFINSCYSHCQSEMQETWFGADSPMLAKTPIAMAAGDWFYDRNAFQKIDCPYPCDLTCHNRVFDDNYIS